MKKYFPSSEPTFPLRWDLFFQPLPLLFLAICLILTGVAWFLWKKREGEDLLPGPTVLGASDKSLKIFYSLVPVILGVHLTFPLLVNGIEGRLFFSNYPVKGIWANWIGLTEITIALSLFYGGLARLAAVLLGLLWALGVDLVGLLPMVKSIQYMGFAIFFYLAGRGPFAIDRLLFPNLEPNATYIDHALLFLRIGVGLNLIVFGFTEKLANIPLASSLLENHAFLNLTKIPNQIFVLIAGAAEIFAGLLILFGIFPRTVALIAAICINASLTIYDWNELVNLLPMYAALAILMVWEPNNPKQKLLWVEGLRRYINVS